MRILFSPQFRFTPVVLAVPASRTPLEVARLFLSQCYLRADETLTPEGRATVEAYTLLNTAPECVNAAASIEALSDEAHRKAVQEKCATLAITLQEGLPRLTGEFDVTTRLTALARSFAGLSAGTVVYERRTDQSHLIFLMQHIQIGLRTGIYRLIGIPEEPPAPVSVPVPVRSTRPRVHAMVEASDPNLETLKVCAISAASCLAWALPPPFGPAAAAGMAVIDVLFGGRSGGSQTTLATRAIKDYIDQNSVLGDAAKLEAFSTWMTTTLAALAKMKAADGSSGVDDTDYDRTVPHIIETLRISTGPNGSAYLALFDLKNHLASLGGIDLTLLAVGLYLVALKMIMQLDIQTLAWRWVQPDADGAEITELNKVWLNDYSVFIASMDPDGIVPETAKAITQTLDGKRKQRLDKITLTREEGFKVSGVPPLGHWTVKDADAIIVVFPDTVTIEVPCCQGPLYNIHQYQAEARATYELKTTEVAVKFDRDFKYVRDTIQQWSDSVKEWSRRSPPLPPKGRPTIDPLGWTGKPPAPQSAPAWVAGSTVSYAVAFVNSRGPGLVGEFTERVLINPATGATLIDLPTDPLKMAEKLEIHRRITTSQGNNLERIAAVVNHGTTRWQDTAK